MLNDYLLNSYKLEIDLAFVAFPVQDIDISCDIQNINLLKSSNLWSKEIANWIMFIQSNADYKCPKIVRNTSKFSLGLELTNDKKISDLNHAWLGNSKSTDVLSFPIIDENSFVASSEFLELGDIVISIPTAIKQARENNIELYRELRWLTTHGLLHLLGWDHCDEESLNKMLLTQEQLIDLRAIL